MNLLIFMYLNSQELYFDKSFLLTKRFQCSTQMVCTGFFRIFVRLIMINMKIINLVRPVVLEYFRFEYR